MSGQEAGSKPSPSRLVGILLAMWLAMFGMDVLLNAGILARFYLTPDPFLVAPQVAFRRIPFGYTSFLLTLALLLWLMVKAQVAGAGAGFRFGLLFGVLLQGAGFLGLYSITTANPWWLLGGAVGQAVQLSLVGALGGAGLGGARLRRLFGIALALVVVCVVITVALQNLGLAPVMHR